MSLFSQANPGGWIFPGLVTVLVGTAASVFVTEPGIEADLSARATAFLAETGLHWAGVRVSGRDVIVTGTATDPAELDRAVAVVADVAGVRSVAGEARLAPAVSPYPFKARREAGAITLSGGIPDEADRARLIADAGSAIGAHATDRLELLSGAPDAERWRAVTAFALRLVAGLDRGEVALADLELSLSGRAASAGDYDSVRSALAEAGAEGLTVGRVELAPPLARPYTWSADFTGGVLTLEGSTPTDSAATLIAGAVPGGIRVVDLTRLGSGAPQRFAETAIVLVDALTRLQSGRAAIADTEVHLSGVPLTSTDADAVAQAVDSLAAMQVALELAPPVQPDVVPYLFAVTKTEAGILFSGNVPSGADMEGLANRYGSDAISGLAVSPGAPEDFVALMENGLEALASLEAGTLGFDGDEWSLRGRAVSDLRRHIAQRVLQRLPRPDLAWQVAVAAPPPLPPPVSPYLWSASRTEAGLSLAGNVPDPQARTELSERLGEPAKDVSVVARGAPADFTAIARNGLQALAALQSGVVFYDGARWTLTGHAADEAALAAARAAVAADPQPPGEWIVQLFTPPPARVAASEPPAASAPIAEDAQAATLAEPEPLEPDAPPEPVVEAPASVASIAPPAPEPAMPKPAAPETLVSALPDPGKTPTGIAPEEPAETASIEAITPESTLSAAPGDAPPVELREFSPPLAVASVPPSIVAPGPPPPPASTFAFAAERTAGGAVTLTGEVPNFTVRGLLELVVEGRTVNNTRLGPDAPPDFLRVAGLGLAALAELRSGRLAFEDGSWRLSGEAEDDGARARALDRIARAPDGSDIRLDIATLDPVALCRLKLADFDSSNTILFSPGSARLTPDSFPALARVAADLNRCPAADVHVEGHTDADGTDDYNLALSLARAEAVVDELIELGVNSNRLYAVGYGETLPIASNQTSGGKARNRRIVFGLVEPGN